MTDRRELKELQDKARRAGRVVTFFFDEIGNLMNGVFYLDPMAKGGSLRAGKIIPLLSFAEIERERPVWWQIRA